MLHDLEDSDLEPGLVTAVLAASASSGAAREKLLEGDVFADLAEERHQEQTVAAVLLLLPVAGALLGVAEVILLGVVALAEEQLQEQIVAAVPLLVAVTLPGAAVVILLGEVALAAELQGQSVAAAEVEALQEPFAFAAAAVEVAHLEPYAPAAVAVEHQEPFEPVPYYSRFVVAVEVVGLVQIAAAVVGLV